MTEIALDVEIAAIDRMGKRIFVRPHLWLKAAALL